MGSLPATPASMSRFDKIITAEDVGAYKPAPNHFEALDAALAELNVPRARLLHVAQSLFHDHVPAKRYGLASVWINRRHDRPGWGATPEPAEEVRLRPGIPVDGGLRRGRAGEQGVRLSPAAARGGCRMPTYARHTQVLNAHGAGPVVAVSVQGAAPRCMGMKIACRCGWVRGCVRRGPG